MFRRFRLLDVDDFELFSNWMNSSPKIGDSGLVIQNFIMLKIIFTPLAWLDLSKFG